MTQPGSTHDHRGDRLQGKLVGTGHWYYQYHDIIYADIF